MMSPRILAAAAVVLALGAAEAAAQCPAEEEVNRRLFVPDPRLARTWTAAELLVAGGPEEPPRAWLPHTIVDANGVVQPNAGEDPGHPELGSSATGRWRAAHREAVERLHALVLVCPDAELTREVRDEWVSEAFSADAPTALMALEAYVAREVQAGRERPRTPLLAKSLGHPGALPPIRFVQLGLAQAVTRGQPAVAPSVSISPFRTDGSFFLRHLTFSGSGLVVTPASAPPIAASFDGYVGSSSEVRADDWYRAVNRRQVENQEAFNRIRADTFRWLVREYRAQAPGLTTPEARAAAVGRLAARALENYRSDIATYYRQTFIEPVERARGRLDWSAAVRGRVTPDATWVADVVDLASAGAEGAFRYDLTLVGGFEIGATGGLLVAASWFPVSGGNRLDGGAPAQPSLLTDANLGLTAVVPPEGGLGRGARVSLAALWRYRLDRRGGLGFSAALEVPISGSFGLGGHFTLRCGEGRPSCDSTSSLTLAVAAD